MWGKGHLVVLQTCALEIKIINSQNIFFQNMSLFHIKQEPTHRKKTKSEVVYLENQAFHEGSGKSRIQTSFYF